MTKDEIVRKNISLVFDFLRYLTEYPEMIERIPDGCEIEFLDKDFPLANDEANSDEDRKIFLKVERTFGIGA